MIIRKLHIDSDGLKRDTMSDRDMEIALQKAISEADKHVTASRKVF